MILHNSNLEQVYSVKNTETQEETVVFLNRFVDLDSLIIQSDSGELKGFNFKGEELSAPKIGAYLRQLKSDSGTIKSDNLESKNLWNIWAAPIIISTIRGKFLSDQESGIEINADLIFEKFSVCLSAFGVGAFQTAAALVLTIEPDEYLTNELLTKISNLAISADAFSN